MYLFFFLSNLMPFVFERFHFLWMGRWFYRLNHIALLFYQKLELRVFSRIFHLSLHLFFVVYFYALIFTNEYIIVASLLNGICGFCVIFMMCALEFHVFHKSLISFISETYERTSDLNDDYDAGGKPRKLGLK